MRILAELRYCRCWGLGMGTRDDFLTEADYELCDPESTGGPVLGVYKFRSCVQEYYARQLAAESARAYGGEGVP